MDQLNGLDTTIIENLVNRYKVHPDEANSSWSSTVVWQSGFHVEVGIRDHETISVDEPLWLAGANSGPNPVELLLGALGSCMSIGFIATASFMGVKVHSLETKVSGDIDLQVFLGLKEGNSGFDHISVNFKVDSPADEEQIQSIISQVVKLSPVKNTIERMVSVETGLTRV